LRYVLQPLEEREDSADAANIAWTTLRDLAAGRPFIPILPDGREAEPQVPTSAVRMKASIELLNRLFGKTPTATERTEASRAVEANTIQSFDELTDAELVGQVRSALDALEQPSDADPSGDGS
jgi:hypothetical protein